MKSGEEISKEMLDIGLEWAKAVVQVVPGVLIVTIPYVQAVVGLQRLLLSTFRPGVVMFALIAFFVLSAPFLGSAAVWTTTKIGKILPWESKI